jgi:hypothetical protein
MKIAEGYQNLRPLVLAGKSLTDTRQLYETLQRILQNNPEWLIPANHLSLQLSGSSLKKPDRLQLQQGNGILLNLPMAKTRGF